MKYIIRINIFVIYRYHQYIYLTTEREWERFSGIGSCNCEGWQVQNLQNSLADWKPTEEPMLQLKSKGSLEPEFLLPQGSSVFFLKALS